MTSIHTYKRRIRTAAAKSGYITSKDCQKILLDADRDTVAVISNWLFSESGIVVRDAAHDKAAIGQQYQQEVMRKVMNPSVEDVKDTKHQTHKNKNKLQKSKKKVEEVSDPAPVTASFNLNKVIDEMVDDDADTEYLPPWKRIEATLRKLSQEWMHAEEWHHAISQLVDAYITQIPENAIFPELLDIFGRIDPRNELSIGDRVKSAIGMVHDISTLRAVMDRLYRGISGGFATSEEQPATNTMHQEQTFELDLGDDAPLELAKASESGLPKILFDKGPEFYVAVAVTPAQKAAGLEVVDRLSHEFGMLFPFDEGSDVTFHMGRVKFPIDIMFLVEDENAMKVGSIIHDAIPGSLDHWSHSNTCAVLEVCGGLCNKLGIKSGDVCHFVRE